jgi:colanic acid/amylovoran biosynthesis glycosyltransferase
MRVCEISHTVPPEVFIRRHVEAMRRYSAVYIVLVGRSPATQPQASLADKRVAGELLMPNYDHLSLPAKVWNLRYALAGNSWRVRRPLRDRAVLGFFDRLQPDLIHFHMAGLAILMRWIPEALGIPYTVSLRGSDIQVEPVVNEGYRQGLKDALCRARGIHCVSEDIRRTAEEVIEQALPHAKVIYTIAPEHNSERPAAPGIGRRPLLLATVGRLHWRKGLEYGVVAIAELRRRGISCRWRVVGEGPCRVQIEYAARDEGVEDAIELVGVRPQSWIRDTLAEADVYFHPAVAEGISNAVIEAMAAGLPVVATRAGGMDEAISHDEDGLLVPTRDWRAMARALEELARDPERRTRLGRAASAKVRERFSASRHSREFFELYQGCFQGRR